MTNQAIDIEDEGPNPLDAELVLCGQQEAEMICLLSEAGATLRELVAYARYTRMPHAGGPS